jgi:hypothetical protein
VRHAQLTLEGQLQAPEAAAGERRDLLAGRCRVGGALAGGADEARGRGGLDSFLFLSGQTLGRDFLKFHFPEKSTVTLTKISIGISAILGVILVWMIPSVIQLWYVKGSIIIPGLLIPVLGIYDIRCH